MLKTCTFTIMHFIIAFLVAGLLSGSWVVGGAIALVEPLCNSVGYFFHEKFWDKRREAKQNPMNDEYAVAHARVIE